MSTTTVEQTTTQENVKDSKSSQSVSETLQGTETKKKPGPKPKVKVEDTKSKEDAKSKEVTSTSTSTEISSESAAQTESENHESQHNETPSEQAVVAETATSVEVIKANGSEYLPAHVLQRCPIYRTPSTKGVVLIMISGFVFANTTCTDGFYKVKYNSFERGTRTGYVESKYIAFGAKK